MKIQADKHICIVQTHPVHRFFNFTFFVKTSENIIGSLSCSDTSCQSPFNYFLRVIPTSWHVIGHIYSDIPPGILSGLPCGILLDIYSGILSDIHSGRFFGICFSILFGIYPDVCATILSDVLFVKYFGILFGGWGPAALTAIGPWRLRFSGAHCAHYDRTLAVEVQRCSLRSWAVRS